MASFPDYVDLVSKRAVDVLVFVMTQIFVLARYFIISYPEASRIIGLAIGAYVLFKSFTRLVRMWWRMMKFAAKLVFGFLFICLLFGLYVRGPQRFLTTDLPSAWRFFKMVKDDYEARKLAHAMEYANFFTDDGADGGSFRESASQWFSENVQNIDKSNAEDFVRDNMENIQNLMGNDRIKKVMNMGFGNLGNL